MWRIFPGINVLKKEERGVVFRIGLFARVVGPGLIFHIPVLELVVPVDLDRSIPEWTTIPEFELKKYVRTLVVEYPEIPETLSHLSLFEFRDEMMRLEQRQQRRSEASRKAVALARAGQTQEAMTRLREVGIDEESARMLLGRD